MTVINPGNPVGAVLDREDVATGKSVGRLGTHVFSKSNIR